MKVDSSLSRCLIRPASLMCTLYLRQSIFPGACVLDLSDVGVAHGGRSYSAWRWLRIRADILVAVRARSHSRSAIPQQPLPWLPTPEFSPCWGLCSGPLYTEFDLERQCQGSAPVCPQCVQVIPLYLLLFVEPFDLHVSVRHCALTGHNVG